MQREEDPDLSGTAVGILTTITDTDAAVNFYPVSRAVIVEEEVVLKDLPTLANAVVLCFGLIYAFHLDYPKKLNNTFTFIQKLVMCLDDNKPLKPCLLTLKNELLEP